MQSLREIWTYLRIAYHYGNAEAIFVSIKHYWEYLRVIDVSK